MIRSVSPKRFPLSGLVRDLHPGVVARARANQKRGVLSRVLLFINCTGQCVLNSIVTLFCDPVHLLFSLPSGVLLAG
jgi:hypothetical protein